MKTGSAKKGGWSVDLCVGSPDGSTVVTIEGPQLYLYFTCESLDELRAAIEFLRLAGVGDALRIGTFCTDLFVELDRFENDPEVVYLSVTKPDDQAMAYALRRDESTELAEALRAAVETVRAQVTGST
jgi:hypothetical protein